MTTRRSIHESTLGAAAFFLLFAPIFARAGDVRLRTTATVAAGQAVRLAQVADLHGEDALAFADAVIVAEALAAASGRPWVEVSIEDVRRALAGAGARLSAIALSGGTCTVRLGGSPSPDESTGNTAAPPPEPRMVDLSGPPTVRKQSASALASMLGVGTADLRLSFDERDAEFLDRPRLGVRIAVQPVSSSGSARAMLSVRVFDGDRLVESGTVRADVLVRRRVVVVQSALRRKDAVEAGMLAEQEAWLPAGGGRPIGSIDEAAGSLARTRLDAGTILLAEHLEPPIVVRRNELVTVHAVRGSFEVKTRARARCDARRGEVIDFRPEGSKTWFAARVAGPGVAVVDLDEPAATQSEYVR